MKSVSMTMEREPIIHDEFDKGNTVMINTSSGLGKDFTIGHGKTDRAKTPAEPNVPEATPDKVDQKKKSAKKPGATIVRSQSDGHQEQLRQASLRFSHTNDHKGMGQGTGLVNKSAFSFGKH